MLEELKRQRAELDARIAEFEMQWEPKGGDWRIALDWTAYWRGTHKLSAIEGRERQTKELAEKAAKEMRKFNRLLAYRDEFCPDYVPEWSCEECPYFVFFSNTDRKWLATSLRRAISPGIVYFPEKIAEELVEKLNNGTVVL